MEQELADSWRGFQDRFMELAREEQRRADVITKGEMLRRMDKVLRISCNYQKHPEIWINRENPEERNFCLLDTPRHGLWGEYTGALSENFRERVRLCVAQAGRALPDYPTGTDPEDFWLHRLYLDLLKNNSDSLFCASKEGGMILSVCVASATFCARLEREALQQPEPENMPERKPPIDIDRAIASWKRMHEIDGDAELSGRGGNTGNKIPKEDVEFIGHEVWVGFFNAASLPRPVELEWESVLSSKKSPDQYVDLGLTFALTKEYAKAISQAVGKLADLLATAAISRHLEMTLGFREALWRECLDFANRLGQWDTFTTWVERVTRIKWEAPLMPDGSVDSNKLQEGIAKRRPFFEERISMYGLDWLSAADGAINLRVAASAPETTTAEKNGKTTQRAQRKSANATRRGDPEIAKRTALVRSNPGSSAAEMCQIFDRQSVPLPAKWQEAGFNTWAQAYKDPKYRSRIDTLISKDKAKN